MIRYLKIAILLPCLMLMGAGFKYGGIKHDITVTAKSGATTTLTASSSQVQSFTGTSAQTVNLPSGLTLSNGYWFTVNNEGTTGSVVVRDASASILSTLTASQSSTFYMNNALVIGGNWSVIPGAGTGSGGGGGGGGGGSTDNVTLFLEGSNGWGSTDTKIKRFSRVRELAPTYVTYVDSATAGATMTVTASGAGNWFVCATDYQAADSSSFAIVVNPSAKTTDPTTPLTFAQGARSILYATTSGESAENCTILVLSASDIVSIQGNGSSDGGDDEYRVTFQMTYLGAAGSVLHYSGVTGHGSTNTTVTRWGTGNITSGGSDMTFNASAANGDSVTIDTAGTYGICYAAKRSGANSSLLGVTVNGSALTTSINSISYAQGRKTYQEAANPNRSTWGCFTYPLAVNDVVRLQDNGSLDQNNMLSYFTIVKLGATSGAAYLDGSNGHASVATRHRVFDSVADVSNSNVSPVKSSTLGDGFIAGKDGTYITCYFDTNLGGSYRIGIVNNSRYSTSDVNSSTGLAGDVISGVGQGATTNDGGVVCAARKFLKGDVVQLKDNGSNNGDDDAVTAAMALIE